MVGEADLLVEPFATLVAGVGPHAAVGEAKTNRTLNSHLAAVFRSTYNAIHHSVMHIVS